MKRIYFVVILACLGIIAGDITFAQMEGSNREHRELLNLTGDYFGQQLPGDTPEIFAPGLITTGMYTRDIAMMPNGDEIYFCVSVGNFSYSAILFTKRIGNSWTKPEVAPFSGSPKIKDLEPCISPDGKKFYFASNRGGNMDIWVMERKDNQWGEPVNLGVPVNTEMGEFFPSVTLDGTLYFTQDDGKTGSNFIYRSRFKNGRYQWPQKLGPEVNATNHQFNAFISPDESFIIVPIAGLKDTVGRTDYYISFRNDEDKWTGPINMGKAVNTPSGLEYSPYISPDGKYFFFMSSRVILSKSLENRRFTFNTLKRIYNAPQNGNPGIYWIKADFIQSLKPGENKSQ